MRSENNIDIYQNTKSSIKRVFVILALILVALNFKADEIAVGASTSLLAANLQKPELVLQTGHSRSVEAIVFGVNNKWVATGSFDNTIKIWEFETGRELRALTGHTGAVKALERSLDGLRLVSGSNDRTVRIWNVESGEEFKSFAVQDGSAEAVAISPDGTMIAAGTSAGTVYIWNISNGKELYVLKEHTGLISSLAFSPDGSLVASGSSDTSIKTWDASKGLRLKTLSGHSDRILTLRFSQNGEELASGSADKTIRFWKTDSGRESFVLKGHSGSVLALSFTQNGKLISGDSNQSVGLWDLTKRREIKFVIGEDNKNSLNEAQSIAFSPDGKFLAVGKGDRTAIISDTETGAKIKTFENQTIGSYGIAFSSDQRWLASAGIDNALKLWDLLTGQALPSLKGHTGYVTSVVFHPDNQRILSASIDKTVRVWDMVSGRNTDTFKGHTDSIGSVVVGSGGKLVVSGSADRTIRLWDLESRTQIAVLTGHLGEVASVSISPNEKMVASASTDKTVKLWDIESKTNLRTLEGHTAEVDSIVFSPDGQFLASGSADYTVRLWETSTGQLLKTMTGHAAKINSVLFSPDGKLVYSGSQDKTLRVWDVLNGREIHIFNGHSDTIFSMAQTSDGPWLASASSDGSIIVWNKETLKRLATLVSLKSTEDWIVVTPEGFFDGSTASWDRLLWRFDKNTFNVKPVEVFFNEFFFPGLLSDLLKGQKLPSTSDISQKDRRQPTVKISLPDDKFNGKTVSERRVKVSVEVSGSPAADGRQNGSGARDVRLFRNGSLVKLWPGDALQESGKTVLETTVSFIGGQNQLTAYAFNSENIKSSDAHLLVNGAENLRRKGVLYIISVGVGKYANPSFNLNYVELDATEFGNELRLKQSELEKYESIEVISLLNQEATKRNIIAGLKKLAGIEVSEESIPRDLEKLRRAEPEDTIAIFFSGHGTSQNQRFYVLPHDLGYTDPSQTLSSEMFNTVLFHSISDLELENAFRDIDAGNLILVIDACNSGQALESSDHRRGPMNNKGLAQLAYDKGMYILTASQSIESAYVSEALKRSYLSYALVEDGLKTNLADANPKDGQVTIREWFDFATQRVPQLRKKMLEGLLQSIDGQKGLTEEEESSEKAAIDMPTQRPRVFYRRQDNSRTFIISQAN